MTEGKIIVFGVGGVLGSACVKELRKGGVEPIAIGRDLAGLDSISGVRGAIWAQGDNFTGKFSETSQQDWNQIWEANSNYIVRSRMTQPHLSGEQLNSLENSTPGGELVTPEEVAKLVCFLVDEASNGINGQSIIIDNGWTLSRHV